MCYANVSIGHEMPLMVDLPFYYSILWQTILDPNLNF